MQLNGGGRAAAAAGSGFPLLPGRPGEGEPAAALWGHRGRYHADQRKDGMCKMVTA